MKEWILILHLLGQDVDTGEIDWHEALRVDNITFETCVSNLVDIVNKLQDAGIDHEIYCTTLEREANIAAKEKVDK